MAQGDLVLFNEYATDPNNSVHDFSSDVFKFALVSDTTVAATQTSPTLGDFTEVTGAGYTAGGETLAMTNTGSAASPTATIDSTVNPSWTQNASGPTDIRWGIIYNDTSATDIAVAYVDMRSGGNPISLQAGNISFTFNASGAWATTVNV